MPRFHFNLDNGSGPLSDEEGRELPDLAAARAEAIKGIRSIVGADVLTGVADLGGRLDIADPDGRVLLSVPFAEAVEIHVHARPDLH